MKKTLGFLFLTVLQLCSASVLYEGFHPDKSSRTGWSSGWHRQAGEVAHTEHSLNLPGLKSDPGALMLTQKGEALAQHKVSCEGTYYGAFRARAAVLKRDSLIGLLLARPDLEKLTPKTANIAFLLKGWRLDYGAVICAGKTVKASAGVPMQAKETYLVLFKVENEKSARSVRMWILNRGQVINHLKHSFSEEVLNTAALSDVAGGVMQRLYLEPKKHAVLGVSAGSVVACVAKFSPKVVFDEIRISEVSLEDAANFPIQ